MRPIPTCLVLAAVAAVSACQLTVVAPPELSSLPTSSPAPRAKATPRPTTSASPRPTTSASPAAPDTSVPVTSPRPKVPVAVPTARASAPPTPQPTRGPDFEAPARQGAEAVVVPADSPEGGPERPTGIAFDNQGRLIVADGAGVHGRLLRLDDRRRATRVAGGTTWPGPQVTRALDLSLFAANAAAAGPGGELYVSTGGTANTLYRIDPAGGVEKAYHHATHAIEHVVVGRGGQVYALQRLNAMSSGAAPLASSGAMGYQVVRIEGPDRETVVIPDLQAEFGRFALGIGPDDALWVAGAGKLQRHSANGLELVASSGEFANPAYALTVDAAGVVHGGTQRSVFRYDPASKAVRTLVTGLSSFPLLAADAQGQVYFTDPVPGGLYLVRPAAAAEASR